MAKFELNEWGEVDIDDVDLNETHFSDKQKLAKKLTTLLLDCSYKDQLEIFTEYILDAWSHEGWGNETFHRDVAQLLSDPQLTESVQEIVKAKE